MERRRFIAVGAVAATGLAGCMEDPGEPGNDTDGNGTDDGSPSSDEDPVTVTDTSFTVRSRGEAVADATPSYWYRDGALHVRGVIDGSDACKTARLADAAWADDREALVVQIETVDAEDAGDMCAQVITPIAYEATVAYEGPRPDLVLEHDGEEVDADEMASGGGENELVSTDFAVTGTECGSTRETADVAREADGASLAVDGVLWGPDGCARAELGYASYDPEHDVLVADVRQTSTEADACTDCITEVSYRLDASFTERPAADVALSHDGVRLDAVGDGVDRASFELVDGDASTPEADASVSFEDDAGRVVVDGVAVGRDGCATVRLAGARVADGALVVDVESVDTRAPGEACTEALTVLEYRAAVQPDGDLPDEVTVRHDGEDVTTHSRSSSSQSTGE